MHVNSLLIAAPRRPSNTMFMSPEIRNLLKLMDDHGLKQAGLAKLLNVKPQAVWNWINRDDRIPPRNHARLSVVLGTSNRGNHRGLFRLF